MARTALTKAKFEGNELDRRFAELTLEIAEARLRSFQARLLVERIKYQQEPGDWEKQAKLAGQAERAENFVLAKEKWLRAEMSVSFAKARLATASTDKEKEAAQASLKRLEQAALAARKAFDAAQAAQTAHQAPGTEDTKYTPLSPQYAATSTGRRKALAEWIAGRDNPLTARVAVNHIWLRHFDRPLVDTVFDFGRNGKRPSHPELLDWLAVEFMESGWSMKHLHRLIVTSNAYRMSSSAASENPKSKIRNPKSNDPDNRYLWRFPAKRM
jgi:hypothetical protein